MSADADAGAGAAAAAEEEEEEKSAKTPPNCHIAADKLPFLLLLLPLTADFEATGGGGREPANINMFKTGRTTEQAAIPT